MHSRGASARAETRVGWSEYSRVRAYELASHTLARVTLPVICTVPGTLALFAVLHPVHPRTIKPYHLFYPYVTREKR